MTDIVLDHGADPTGVADSTAAFASACSLPRDVSVPPGVYKITGGFTNRARLIGVGKPTINLFLTAASDTGIWCKSNASVENFVINKDQAVNGTNGAVCNAVLVGEYSSTPKNDGELYENVSLKNLTINTSGASVKWNNITLIGNVRNIVVENIENVGYVSIPLLMHWTEVSGVSYHPHDITIRNFSSIAPTPADGGYMAPYVSASYNITMENIYGENGSRGFDVAAGDIGGLMAQEPEKILSNIHVKNLVLKNIVNEGAWITGRSAEVSGERWFGTDSNMSVLIDGYTFIRGEDTDTAKGYGIVTWFANNVEVRNYNHCNADGLTMTNDDEAIRIKASTNIRVSGQVKAQNAVLLQSGVGIALNLDAAGTDYTAANSAYNGIVAAGSNHNFTNPSAVSAGGTSITIPTVPCDIVPGMTFESGGNLFTFNGSAVTGDTTVVVPIIPAGNAIASSATVTIHEGVVDVDIRARLKGYYNNLKVTGTTAATHKRINHDLRVIGGTNSISGTDIIDVSPAAISGGGGGSPDADAVTFDPTGLTYITTADVQAALVELDAVISTLSGGGLTGSVTNFTPTMYGSTTAGSPTLSTAIGTAYKVGKLVVGTIKMAWSSLGGAAGEIRFGNLPFAANTEAVARFSAKVSYAHGISTPSGTVLAGFVAENGTYIRFVNPTNTTFSDVTNDAEMTASGEVHVDFVYLTDD